MSSPSTSRLDRRVENEPQSGVPIDGRFDLKCVHPKLVFRAAKQRVIDIDMGKCVDTFQLHKEMTSLQVMRGVFNKSLDVGML